MAESIMVRREPPAEWYGETFDGADALAKWLGEFHAFSIESLRVAACSNRQFGIEAVVYGVRDDN